MTSLSKRKQTFFQPLCFWLLLLLVNTTLNAQGTKEFVLRFHEKPKVNGNLIRFGDLLEIRGDTEDAKRISQLPLVPTPADGTQLQIRREDILQQLQARNFEISQFRWIGDDETIVKSSTNSVVSVARPNPNLLPAFANDRNFIQAERNLKDAISTYLSTQDANLTGATLQIEIPNEYLSLFFQRRNIKRIGGGEPPWIGEQSFLIQVVNKSELVDIPLRVIVTPPTTYVVAIRPLRRGDVIEAGDLRLEVLNAKTTPTSDTAYFTDFAEVIGKQLRRSMASGQAIREEDVGPPIVIEKNQLVQIKVVIGGIEVETAGRAITEGATGDLVQVETINLRERKKLTAQVLDSNSVQVIAAGMNTVQR